MSKRKGLTKPQVQKIRRLLLERQSVLLADSRSKMSEVGDEGAERSGDEADRASASFVHDMAMGTAARESRELKLIEEALARIEAGTYGGCEECGGPIAPARLQALPFAEYCIECQEKLEEEGMMADTGQQRLRE